MPAVITAKFGSMFDSRSHFPFWKKGRRIKKIPTNIIICPAITKKQVGFLRVVHKNKRAITKKARLCNKTLVS